MQDEQIKIEGIVENVVFHSEQSGYTVLEIQSDGELITAVGELGSVSEGEEVILHGEYITHANFGRQFKASLCEARLPEDEGAILKYLASGALPYIGAVVARRIVESFGIQALDVIANDCERLAEVKGLTLIKARAISNEFKRIFNVREAITWLARYGVSAQKAVEVYKVYGAYTVDMVSHDPYLLCSGLVNLPFKLADAMAAELQMDEESDCRVKAAITYILRHNQQNGHTCLPKAKLCKTAADFIHVREELAGRCMDRLLCDEELMCAVKGEKEYIYLPDYYKAEQNIAYHLRELVKLPVIEQEKANKRIDENEILEGIKYAPLQREAIVSALARHALVLTGGPGTGKTTTVNGIIACFEQSGDRVALAAPTGRAAKRLAELTQRKAQTVHRLLEVDYAGEGNVKFIHNENNKLKCDVLVIDEMSMVDTMLFESLLSALKSSCRIIMVGDVDQLPSVGAGNVLGSVIDSKVVPVVCLKEIFRQASQSLIVSNAHRIVNGELPVRGGKSSDYFMMEAGADAAAELICSLVQERLPAAYGYDAIQDIQVLCPTKIGILGTVALNPRLQQLLNPASPAKAQLTALGRIYRVGDKVMQVKNNYDIQYTRDNGTDGVGAFNGDMGIIETVDTKGGTVVVKSEDRRIIYTAEQLKELELAYAVTIHKSQGSEFRAVILPIAEVPQKLCYRNLLYTGVTRARSLCIIVGRNEEVSRMVMNVKSNLRFSCLAGFLRGDAV